MDTTCVGRVGGTITTTDHAMSVDTAPYERHITGAMIDAAYNVDRAVESTTGT